MKVKAIILGAAIFLASPTIVLASSEVHDFYNGVRSLGMGGAYTAVVNDETALLTNPAGLSRLRDKIITLFDPELSGSTNITDVTNIQKTSVQKPEDLLKLLKEHPGKHWYAKAQVFPSFVAPNVGFGLHAKWKYDAQVESGGANYRYDYTNDFAAVLGFSFKFFGGILKVGGSARYINRTELHKDFDPNITSISMNEHASEGAGIGANAGILLTAPVQLLPTLGINVRDVGQTSYTLTSGMFHRTQSRPADSPQVIDVGLALNPILSNTTRLMMTVDYHDVMNAYREEDAAKRLHAGLEFNLDDALFIRAGYNQRYWTAGIELASARFQFQIASYGEEVGTPTSVKEDRRWIGKISLRF